MIESGGASSGRASSGASTRGGESTRDLAGEAPAAIGEAPPPNAREPSAATPAASERAPLAMPAATALGVSLAGLLATFCCLAAGVDGSPGLRAAPSSSLRVARLGDGFASRPTDCRRWAPWTTRASIPGWLLHANGLLLRIWRRGRGRARWLDERPASSRSIAVGRALQFHPESCMQPAAADDYLQSQGEAERRSGERWSNARGLWARPDRPVGSASGSRSSAASTCGRICPAGRAPARPLPTAPMVPADWASEIR